MRQQSLDSLPSLEAGCLDATPPSPCRAHAGRITLPHSRESVLTEIKEHWLCTYSRGINGNLKLDYYDAAKLVKYGAFSCLFVPGTIFTMDGTVTLTLLCQCVIAGGSSMFVVLDDEFNIEAIDGLSDLSTYLAKFVPFVLGLFIALAMKRWWSLRTEALGPAYNALGNICMILSGSLSNTPRSTQIKEQILKYGMASARLMMKAARGQSDLNDLVTCRLMTRKETKLLGELRLYQRSYVMWPWIMRLCFHAFEEEKLPWGVFNSICRECVDARNGIQTIYTYLQTQVPFAYVHLICLIVNMNNVIVSVRSGMVIAFSFKKHGTGSEGIWMAIHALLTMIIVPVIYHGLLAIAYVVHNPFGDHILDFPVVALEDYVHDSCEALFSASECPAELMLFFHTDRMQKGRNGGARPTDYSQVMTAAEIPPNTSVVDDFLPAISDLDGLLRSIEHRLPDAIAASEAHFEIEVEEQRETYVTNLVEQERLNDFIEHLQDREVASCSSAMLSHLQVQ